MGSGAGWVVSTGGGTVTIAATYSFIPNGYYGAILLNSTAGLVCVPKGMGLDVTMAYACAQGTVTVALYDVYCTNVAGSTSCNMKTPVKTCSFVCSSTSEVSSTCTATAQEVGGGWIYAVKVSRSATGGSSVTLNHLTMTPK